MGIMAENSLCPFNNDLFGRPCRNHSYNPCRDNQDRDGDHWGQDYDDCPRGYGDGSPRRRANDNSCGEWQGNRDIHIHNNNANANANQSNANSGACVRQDRREDAYPGYCRGGLNGYCRDGDGSGQRRDGVNLNLSIGCVCAQGTTGSGGGSGSVSRHYGNNFGGNDCRRGEGYETMFPYENRRAQYCVCCGQSMRYLGGRGLVCCEMGWRPRFEGRERRRCGLARCFTGR